MHLTKYFQDYNIRRKIRYTFYTTILFFSIGCLVTNVNVKEDKHYVDFDHVVMYIYEYNELPNNYVPKFQSNLLETDDFTVYATFRNYEKLLPLDAVYTEAYINAKTDDKGAERFVYTTDIVYYTSDHYESFVVVTKSDIQTPYTIFLLLLITTLIGAPVLALVMVKKFNVIEGKELKKDFIDDYQGIKNRITHIGIALKRRTTKSTEEDANKEKNK